MAGRSPGIMSATSLRRWKGCADNSVRVSHLKYICHTVDRHTKLIVPHHIGKRRSERTEVSFGDLKEGVKGRCQLTVDAFAPSREEVICAVGCTRQQYKDSNISEHLICLTTVK